MRRVLICFAVCVLGTACACTENVDITEESPVMVPASTQMPETITQEYVIIQEGTSSRESEESVKIGISDILIPESVYLAEIPFMAVDIHDVLDNSSELEKFSGREGANGHYNYWKGTGIEYVTYSSGGEPASGVEPVIGVILSDSSYSLANRIQAGMAEEDLVKAGYPFEKYESGTSAGRGDLVLESALLRDENSPLNTTDYDYIYAYIGTVSADEAQDYGITATSCYSIVLLIKDGIINKVILDLPTAG